MRDEIRMSPPEYRLALDVDVEGQRWSGSVEFDLAPGADGIELDAEDLEIASVTSDGTNLPFRLDLERHRISISRDPPRGGPVRVGFAGRVDPQRLVGLYRCRNGDGYALTTQCEPISARRVFPCVDRPDAKARIQLVVRAPSGLEVVSNNPPERVAEQGNRREWTFAPTPPMATYLFYLGVGRFDHTEDGTRRVPVRVLTPPGRGAEGRYASAVGSKILRAYEQYYDIPYPLPKLDMIAVSEHAFGAMENWGAMSFRDMRLLLNGSSTSYARADVTETICHEIAHQWFGNLVTMAWWDDIWLNESFASFLEAKITERIAPECEPFTDFLVRRWGMRAALETDSLRATHPVRTPVATPEEIGQVGDEITYGKGSAVLRMVDAFLGESKFRAGVTDYLNRFRYRNARTQDLWDALGRSSNSDVSAMVGPWIDRPGVPVVRAELAPSGLQLTQRRFGYRDPPEAPPWPIPLTLDVNGRRERVLFDTRERTLPLPPGATVHLNPGAIGYYRVHYAPELLDRLLEALPSRPAADRWIVLEDLGAFVVAGIETWSTYERAVRQLGHTTERLIVESLTDSLSTLALGLPRAAPPVDVARRYLREATDLIGLDRQDSESGLLRVVREETAVARALLDDGFAAGLAERYSEWDRLDPDLKRAVVLAYARTGGDPAYRSIRQALERPMPERESLQLEVALAWSGEPSLIASTLDLVASGGINRGHAFLVVSYAAQNPVGRPLVQPWLERNLAELTRTYRGSGLLSLMLETSLPFAGLGRAEATRAFYRDHPIPDASRGIAKGLERLEVFERLTARLAS